MSYNRRLVEQLLPAVWDQTYAYGMDNPVAPRPIFRCKTHIKTKVFEDEGGTQEVSTCACVEASTRKATTNPKQSGTLWAHLGDIRQAWKLADVPQVERQALLLRYGLDWRAAEIGHNQGVSKRTAERRVEAGVGRLTAFLAGRTYDDGDAELDDE